MNKEKNYFYKYNGYDFYIEKLDKHWRATILVTYKDKLYKYTFTQFKTEKETLDKLKLRVDTSQNLDKTIMDNINATINKNYLLNPKIQKFFKKIFGFDLKKCIDPMFLEYGLGFNVVKFDHLVNTPNGVSTINYVEEKFGKIAIKLLNKLGDLEL